MAFTAKFHGRCAREGCRGVLAGDSVVRRDDGRYQHASASACRQGESQTQRHTSPRPAGVRRPTATDLAEGRQKFANFVPSPYQQALRDTLCSSDRHLVVEAVAGSGKSTTLLWLLNTLDMGRTIYLAFNKAIVDEFADRIPNWALCRTLNSAGASILRDHGVRLDPDGRAVRDIYRALYPVGTNPRERNRELEPATLKLAELARGSLVTPTTTSLGPLAATHEVAGYAIDPDEVSSRVAAVINGLRDAYSSARSSRSTMRGDFTCQIWLPSEFNLRPCQTFDTVLIDETQDLNAAQVDLALRFAGPQGRIIAVGDPRQAIYAFRGAGTSSMADLTATLSETPRGVRTLPLSVCYRCPSLVLDLVRTAGYHTTIEARPHAPRGEVMLARDEDLLDLVRAREPQETLIVSPLNAPLMPALLSLVRARIPAGIQGRDAGRPLLALLDEIEHRYKSGSWQDLRKAIDADSKRVAEEAREAEEDPEVATDRHRTVAILCAEVEDRKSFEDLLSTIFVDDDRPRVLLSTVHRAKGLERPQVLILRPDAIPFPWTRQPWQAEQAQNLAYVAFTRAQERLVLVGDKIHPQTQEALAALGLLPPDDDQPPPPPSGGDDHGDDREEPEQESFDEPEPIEEPAEEHTSCAVVQPIGLPKPPPSKGSGEFTPPTLAEWEEIVALYRAQGWYADLVVPRGWKQRALVVSDGNGHTVRVSTTVDVRGTGSARDKGVNAIDICRIHDMIKPHGVPCGGSKKALRTEGWQGRVVERVNDLLRVS